MTWAFPVDPIRRRIRARGLARARHLAALSMLIMVETCVAADTVELTPLPLDGWRLITDGVMGGVSRGELVDSTRLDAPCLGFRGQVSTRNNGGFIQIALDIDAEALATRDHEGIRLEVIGNAETYNVHLRTADLWLPWQSYRASFEAVSQWREIRLPFTDFAPYKTRTKLDVGRLRRIGIVAIGRDFEADICVKAVGLYHAAEPE